MWWTTCCLSRVSRLSRGRAVPLGWRVLKPGSAAGALETSTAWWEEVQSHVPLACQAVLWADRGCAATPLLSHWSQLGGHVRLRITTHFGMHPGPLASLQVGEIALQPGHRGVWQGVSRTDNHGGPGHLAVARPRGSEDYGEVISAEAAALKPCDESGLRCDMAETFWDDPAHGLPLDASLLRSAEAWERWCVVRAVTTLSWGALGTFVVPQGKRRWGDPHGFRGLRDVKMGWNGGPYALIRGDELLTTAYFRSDPASDPALASKKQDAKRRQGRLVFAWQEAA